MNSRDYKIFRAGHCYHIYNRGNHKEEIFLDDQDFLNFFKRLNFCLFGKSAAGVSGRLRITTVPFGAFDILSYCLMPNHFHFLIRQNLNLGIDRLISRTCTSYVKYFNNKYDRVGNLFQDAFKAKLVYDDSYLTYLTAYIHNNPSNPLEYAYSSFKDYLGERSDRLCSKDFILSMFQNNSQEYKKFVLNFSAKDQDKIQPFIFEEEEN